jgi:ribosomal protein L11 methylase PrmA
LQELVSSLRLPDQSSTWSDYYDEARQRNDYMQQKQTIISNWVDQMKDVKTCADMGANTGEYSKITAAKDIFTIAADADPYCIGSLYKHITESGEQHIHPLILDISHPSPAIGVNNEERMSFINRTTVDLVMALALIHHLCIGKNIPFNKVADFFSGLGKRLIIEFVPKNDPKVTDMLAGKKDIYTNYTESSFEEAFKQQFNIDQKIPVPGSARILYLMTQA